MCIPSLIAGIIIGVGLLGSILMLMARFVADKHPPHEPCSDFTEPRNLIPPSTNFNEGA